MAQEWHPEQRLLLLANPVVFCKNVEYYNITVISILLIIKKSTHFLDDPFNRATNLFDSFNIISGAIRVIFPHLHSKI